MDIQERTDATQPLLKWPGGKRSLASRILENAPKKFRSYFEPFVGGGAVFFALRPQQARLSDLNPELVECYEVVRDSPDKLLEALQRFSNSESEYYRVREMIPRTKVGKAARFLYLMRLSFNGIHRVNLKGKFNVPYGQKTHLRTSDRAAILSASAALAGARLEKADFELATASASHGDLVYFDPPYTVAHANNGFVKYNEQIFSWSDQKRLANHAAKLAARGCHVLVSNADHPSVRALYPSSREIVLSRFSIIAAASEHRRSVTESLFVLGPNSD